MEEGTLEQVLNIEPGVELDDDNWELDAKACRIDGHAMVDGELCEACQ